MEQKDAKDANEDQEHCNPVFFFASFASFAVRFTLLSCDSSPLSCSRCWRVRPPHAPLTRGLKAALPYVDDFVAARTLTDLAALAVQLNAIRSG